MSDLRPDIAAKVEEWKQAAAEYEEEPPDPEREANLHRAYLAAVGFGRRYCEPQWTEMLPEAQRELRPYCDRIAEHIAAGEGATLYGGVGTGKTHALGLIALAAAKVFVSVGIAARKRPRVRYVFAPDLYDALWSDSNPEARARVLQWQGCELLLLDDADRLYGTAYNISRFESFVERRHGELRATCITVNSGELFRRPELARTVDRWRETTTVRVKFSGESRRRDRRDSEEPRP